MRGRGIIVLVKLNQLVKNIETKQLSRRFSLLVGYNIKPRSSSTNQNAALIIDHELDFTKKAQMWLEEKRGGDLLR